MEIQKLATMNEVVMKKGELLTRLIENKAKHDAVLSAAIEGYWETAKAKLEAKKKKLVFLTKEWDNEVTSAYTRADKQIKKREGVPFFSAGTLSFDTNLSLTYPQDHGKDYDRAIHMMQASIYDEVKLSVDEFDSYVLNNWEWKANFLSNTTSYLGNMKGKNFRNDSKVLSNITGSYIRTYGSSLSGAYNTIMMSGCLPNF